MKKTIIIILVLFSINSFAQTQEQLKKANQLLANKKINEATTIWTTIQTENKLNANFNFKLGLCYYRSFDQGYKSLEYFKKAVKRTKENYDFFSTKENGSPIDSWFFLAEAFMLNYKPDSALQNYLVYLKKVGTISNLPAQQRIIDCLTAENYLKNSEQKQKLENLGIVNGNYSETNPIVSWDESALYFSSYRFRGNESGSENLDLKRTVNPDIYVSHLINNKWSKPELLEFSIAGGFTPHYISRNGNVLYFSHNEGTNSDIYYSELKDKKWGIPVKLPFNSDANELGFTMSADETKAWFSSNRSGGKGGYDLYYCEKTSSGWSAPINVSELNTESDELNPFVNADGKSIFFSSNGYLENRMGGFDIYLTELTIANKWAKPINLGSPINTTGDDLYFTRSASDNLAYISRIEPNKGFDLFQVEGFDFNEYEKHFKSLAETSFINSNSEDYSDVQNAIKEISKTNSDASTKKLIEGLEPQIAAKVIDGIEKDLGIKVMTAIEPSKAAAIMNYMEIEKAVEVTSSLPIEKSSQIIQLLDIDKSIAVMNEINAPKASMITERLETAKAVKVMEGLSANSSSSIINNMNIEKAVGVMEGIETQKATGIMQGVEIEKAVDVVEKMSTEKSDNILAGLEVEKATNILESMNIEKAVDIMEGMPVEKAVDVMEGFDLSKSIEVVSAMDNPKAANVIQNMDLTKAVAVMDGIPKEKAVDYIQGMEVEKAVGLMSEMNSEKSSLIVEDLQKQVKNEAGKNKVVALLKKYFAGQISKKESIIFKTVYFDFNSSELLLLSKNELLMLVDFLRENKIVKIEVVGHTDNVGDWDANLKVSGDRAKVVYDFLRRNKIEHDRIIFYGKGPAAPIATNGTEYGRKLNRRVEVILLQ